MSGINPITVEAITSYCFATNDDFEEIFDIITSVDSSYRKDAEEHAKLKSNH